VSVEVHGELTGDYKLYYYAGTAFGRRARVRMDAADFRDARVTEARRPVG
jgi:hypothetical protein